MEAAPRFLCFVRAANTPTPRNPSSAPCLRGDPTIPPRTNGAVETQSRGLERVFEDAHRPPTKPGNKMTGGCAVRRRPSPLLPVPFFPPSSTSFPISFLQFSSFHPTASALCCSRPHSSFLLQQTTIGQGLESLQSSLLAVLLCTQRYRIQSPRPVPSPFLPSLSPSPHSQSPSTFLFKIRRHPQNTPPSRLTVCHFTDVLRHFLVWSNTQNAQAAVTGQN